MVKTLDSLEIGEAGTIVKVNGEGKVTRRLFDMGVTPGAEVFLRKRAPLGDPIEITLRGYELSLRKDEASAVEVELSKEASSLETTNGEKDKVKKTFDLIYGIGLFAAILGIVTLVVLLFTGILAAPVEGEDLPPLTPSSGGAIAIYCVIGVGLAVFALFLALSLNRAKRK